MKKKYISYLIVSHVVVFVAGLMANSLFQNITIKEKVFHSSNTTETTVEQCIDLVGDDTHLRKDIHECFENLSADEFLNLFSEEYTQEVEIFNEVMNHFDDRTEEQKAQDAKEVEEFFNELEL